MWIRRISILLFTPLLIALTWGVVEAKKQNPHKDQPKTWVDVQAYRGSGGPAYLAYGDSITHGYGSTLPYPSLRTWQLEQDTGTGLILHNNGVNGYWSGQLVNHLNSSAARAGNRQSRYITVSIGYNDMSLAKLCYLGGACGGDDGEQYYRDTIRRFKTNWDQVLSSLTSSCLPNGTRIAVATQYEALVAEGKVTYSNPQNQSVNDREIHKKYLEQMNTYITSTDKSKRVAVADLHSVFNGPNHDTPIPALWLYDAAHPNARGDVAIAGAFQKLGTKTNCVREVLQIFGCSLATGQFEKNG